MKTRQEAESCVNDLNGYEWFGRKIGVRIDETGGHHALAAAAMAGATLWEGVSFSHTDYEVLSHIPLVLFLVFLFSFLFFFYFDTCKIVLCDTPRRYQRRLHGGFCGWGAIFLPFSENLTNVCVLIGSLPAVANLPCKWEYDESLFFTVDKSSAFCRKCTSPSLSPSFNILAVLTCVMT